MKLNIAVGAQWGDEGKGKINLHLAQGADICMRCGGGSNAECSVYHEGKEFHFRMLPAGMVRGRIGLIGDGVLIRCDRLMKDVQALEAHFGDLSDRLIISGNAHVVMPDHVRLDGRNNDTGKTETIREGVGPAVADRAHRIGVTVDQFIAADGELAHYEPWEDRATFVALLKKYRGNIKEYLAGVRNSDVSVMIQGSQALMLDAIHGVYPAVTSTNTTTTGMLYGAGLPYSAVTRNIGICKAFPTRFDDTGPLPTEIPSPEQERIRALANEFCHVPIKALRVGYQDLVALRYSHQINDYSELCLNKIDVMTGLDRIPICVGYERDGRVFDAFYDWHTIADRPVTPVYEYLPGWTEDIRGAQTFTALPRNAQNYISFIEETVGVPIRIIGTGPADHEMIVR